MAWLGLPDDLTDPPWDVLPDRAAAGGAGARILEPPAESSTGVTAGLTLSPVEGTSSGTGNSVSGSFRNGQLICQVCKLASNRAAWAAG